MSEAVTALSGASFKGLIRVEDAGLTGMVTLRGDLSGEGVARALGEVGREVPGQGAAVGVLGAGTLWMSPDELLVLCDHGEAEAVTSGLSKALSDEHALAVNVSDARTVIRLSGEGPMIREVLAKLSPADLRASVLPVGQVRRTRLAQVAAAFWFASEDEAYVVAFRSVGDYVFKLLSTVAEEGSAVGYF